MTSGAKGLLSTRFQLLTRDFDDAESLLTPRENRPSSPPPHPGHDAPTTTELSEHHGNPMKAEAEDVEADEGESKRDDPIFYHGDRRIQALPLRRPVAFSEKELALWAASKGYTWDAERRRIYDPRRLRQGLGRFLLDPERCAMAYETILALDAVSGGEARVVVTSLSVPGLEAELAEVGEAFPTLRALLATVRGEAAEVMARFEEGEAAAENALPRREKAAPDAHRMGNPLTPGPITAQQLQGALPVPEGTCGVFHLDQDETVDICSAAFATCVGVVLVARHPNGSRSVGMAHLNTDSVERQAASFERFVAEVTGDDASPFDVYLVGGAASNLASRTLVVSLFELFAAIAQARVRGTSLFTDDPHKDYVVRSAPEGETLHIAKDEDEAKALAERQHALEEHHDVYRAANHLSTYLGLAPLELIAVCSDGRHPMAPPKGT